MSSVYGPDGPREYKSKHISVLRPTLECQLFESLVHHLIEKGVLTKNDALSVVQTVAEVKQGELEESQPDVGSIDNELRLLRGLYSSFELLRGSALTSLAADSDNVLQLRPPLHADHPEFPKN